MSNVNGEMLSNANTDMILASILNNFDTQYIIDIVRKSINIRFRPYNTAMPSIGAFEQHFQQMLISFTDQQQKEKILAVREDTYLNIIRVVCEYYNLEYYPNDDIDTHTVVYFLYDVLVSNFTNTIINFFVNYIMDHQSEIYIELNNKPSGEKETMSPYSKKLYNNSPLGLIHSNIGTVMNNICVKDIKLSDILHYGYNDPNCLYVLNNTIGENGNVFKDRFATYVYDMSARIDLITCVRLNLQQYAVSDMNIINY